MIFKSFKEATRLVIPVWYQHWLLWLLIFGGVEFANQLLIAFLDGFEASQVSYLLSGLITSTLEFTLAVMVPPVVQAVREKRPSEMTKHFNKFINQACIESLRST